MTRRIIMIHGAFCGGWAFDAFRRPFDESGMRVQAIDLPGHGSKPDRLALSRLSMQDFAGAVVAACEAEPEPPILIGHSLGGLVAQIAATKTTLAGLILLAPSAPWGVAGITLEEAVSAVSLYMLGPFWTLAIDPDYSLARQYSLNRLEREDRKAIYGRMGPESGRALWETLNWWLDPFLSTQVPATKVRAPVLAVAGGRDLIHPPMTVRQTASRLGGEVIEFPEMSHWLIGEPGHEDVAKACLDWIGAL